MPPSFARAVVPLGIAQTLAWGSTYYLPAILAQHMAADTGTGTALVFAAFSCALLDKHGGRRVLAASSLVLAAGLAFLGSSSSAGTLFAAWLVLGVGMSAGLYEAAFSTLAGIFGQEARRPITGITLIAGFASTVCWPISAWMDAELGWRTACFLWAGVQVLAWFCSTAMAAHLPRLLQEAGASLAAAVAAAALVGPAQVAARVMEFWLMRHAHPVVSARIAALAHPVGAPAGGRAVRLRHPSHALRTGRARGDQRARRVLVRDPRDAAGRERKALGPQRFGTGWLSSSQ